MSALLPWRDRNPAANKGFSLFPKTRTTAEAPLRPFYRQGNPLPIDDPTAPCSRCQKLGIHRFMKRGRGNEVQQRFGAEILGFHPSCNMCKMLRNIPKDGTPVHWLTFHVAYNYGLLLGFVKYTRLEVCLESDPDRNGGRWDFAFSGWHNKSYQRRKAVMDPIPALSIHWKPLKSHLVHCIQTHGEVCNASQQAFAEDIRLINCQTREIELAKPNATYIALSYVWGPGDPLPEDCGGGEYSKTLPARVEQTIEDAAAVVTILGYRYLWVDKYCINQADPHKHKQLRQMHTIYRNAELTIIAAAGNNHDYGLPGVSVKARKRGTICRSGQYFVREVASESRQKHIITQSKWNSRAWTYQEALFSRRRLIFTDQEVSFYCVGTDLTHGSELHSLLHHSTSTDVAYTRRRPPRILSAPVLFGPGHLPWDVGPRITEYSRRALTYDSDMLNAFLGVLSAFEDFKDPVYHLWGTPVLPPLAGSKHTWLVPLSEGSPAVSRIGSDGFLHAFSWRAHAPTTRRPGFPSWSWTGWYGEIDTWDYKPSNFDWKGASGVTVSVELSNGKLLTWAELSERRYLKDRPNELSTFIWLDAWTTKVRLDCYRSPAAVFVDTRGRQHRKKLFLDDSVLQDYDPRDLIYNDSFVCVIIGPLHHACLALVVQDLHGVAERIGTVNLDGICVEDDKIDLSVLGLKPRLIRLG